MGFWVMCSSNVFKTEGSPEVTFWSFHCFNRSRRWWRKGLNDGIKKAYHATFPFDWKKKKTTKNPFLLSWWQRTMGWEEQRNNPGNQACTSCPQGLWHVLLSSSFLSPALLLRCDEKQNQPCVSVCGFWSVHSARLFILCLKLGTEERLKSTSPRSSWSAPHECCIHHLDVIYL